MHKYILIIVALTNLLLVSCGSEIDKINNEGLRSLIVKAISGDPEANEKLPGFLTDKHIHQTNFNDLTVESLAINNKVFYSVLLEYYDPTLNLFAIFDDQLNMYLLDKSLNGYLSSEWNVLGKRRFVFVQESFLTKDVLSLDRLSIYEIFENSAALVYRSLSRFVKENKITNQTVESITENIILTKITGLSEKEAESQIDTFYFNPGLEKYLSKSDLFNNYVKQQIKEFNWTVLKSEIPAEIKDSGSDSVKNVN
ncbi:MAG: hypothetical protein IPM14_13395 [bacterium]|nr:hypothetical protein [bacterium]